MISVPKTSSLWLPRNDPHASGAGTNSSTSKGQAQGKTQKNISDESDWRAEMAAVAKSVVEVRPLGTAKSSACGDGAEGSRVGGVTSTADVAANAKSVTEARPSGVQWRGL